MNWTTSTRAGPPTATRSRYSIPAPRSSRDNQPSRQRRQDVGHTSCDPAGHIVNSPGAATSPPAQLAYGNRHRPIRDPPRPCTPGSRPRALRDPTSRAPPTSARALSGSDDRTPPITTGSTATNVNGQDLGGDRTVTPAAVLNVETGTGRRKSTKNSATFTAPSIPDTINTTYHFEYGAEHRLPAEHRRLGWLGTPRRAGEHSRSPRCSRVAPTTTGSSRPTPTGPP